MALLVRCTSCGTEFRSDARHRGRTTTCAHCGQPLVVDGTAIPDHDVFISYSSSDKHAADAICAALEAKRWRCWIAPRNVLAGSEWGASIIEGIEQSRLMVLVYSANANRSQQVLREIERAVSKGLAIIPFRIEASPPSKNMEYFLSTSHWMDALTEPLARHIDELADSVKRLLAARDALAPAAAAAPGGERATERVAAAPSGAPLGATTGAVPGAAAPVNDRAAAERPPRKAKPRRTAVVVGVAALACAAVLAAVVAKRPPRAVEAGAAASQPTTSPTSMQPAAITSRTLLVSRRPFKLHRRFPEMRLPVTVPPMATGSGWLQIRLRNMGDNAGDGGMHCGLLDANGNVVRQWFDHRDRTFQHEVTSGSSWTVVLRDADASRDGNGGGVEIAVEPK